MPRFAVVLAAFALASMFFAPVHAQPAIQTQGVLVIVPAYAEVKQANDEARATFFIEEQDADKAVAASRVNLKMRQGMEILRREDPQAKLETRGYNSYPVYAEDQPASTKARRRQPAAWRVSQYLEVTTSNLERLPNAVAAAQSILALQGLTFGLRDATLHKLEEQRIDLAYRQLTEKIAAIAKAMGRNVATAELESIEFDGNSPQPIFEMRASKAMRGGVEAQSVELPGFEPGETTLSTRILGRVRFK